jgi:hypothetical protein
MKGLKMEENKFEYNYRVDLDAYKIEILQKYIQTIKEEDISEIDLIMFNEMKEIINNPKKIKKSFKKSIAADRATEARTANAKKKIENAMNILRMENKKLTHYAIAKMAGVSFVTVKKYITLDEIK